VNWNRRMHILVPAVALLMSFLPVASPSAAQAPSTAMPTVQSTQSPVGNTAALAKEAEGWLADLIRIDTTNPPGNEEATAKYIAAILTKEGLTPELLELAPGRSALVVRLRSAAMPDPSRAGLQHSSCPRIRSAEWGRLCEESRTPPMR